ncbi:hypothetical protein CPB97_007408 [Podila verticillata]|nr:hypothetical protein CPB97_007408 [Podila verticillata]
MTEWITSEHKPRPQRITQTQLTPAHEISQQSGSSGRRPPTRSTSKSSIASSDDNQGTGRSSTTSTHRQTRLEMGQLSPPKQPGQVKKPVPDALAALQDKLAKDQPKIGGYLSRMGVKPAQFANTGHTSTDKKASTVSTKPTTPKATSSSAAGSTGNKGSAKSKKAPALVSIADKIPRGSRAKPIPPKQPQSPLQTTGPRSPSPPTPHLGKEDTPQFTEDDTVVIDPSPPQLPKHSTPLVVRPKQTRQQPQTIVLSSSPPDSENDSDLEYDAAETNEPTGGVDKIVQREPSILTIESSKTFSMASDIPSIEVDAIERWVGGVRHALGDNDETAAHTAIRTSKSVPEATGGFNSSRQPPSPARSGAHSIIQIDSSPPHVIPSTFDDQEAEPAQAKDEIEPSHLRTPSRMGRQARVLAPDSLSWTASAPLDRASRNLHQVQDDGDISTVVGGQPTQDTFGLRSLPSFVSDGEIMERKNVGVDEQEHDQEPAALPSGLTSSCLQELGLLKRRVSENNSPRKRRTSSGWNSELGSDPHHDDPEDVMMAQRGYFPSSFGAAPSTQSPLSYNHALASIDEDSPKYQPIDVSFQTRLRHAMGQAPSGEDGEEGDGEDGSSHPIESMPGQESYEDFHRRILADARAHVLDSQPSLPSMPSMTGLSTLPSFPSIPSLPTMPSFSSMPSSGAFNEHEQTQEPLL